MSTLLSFLLFVTVCGLGCLAALLMVVRQAKANLEEDLRREQEQHADEVVRLNKGLAALRAEIERLGLEAKWTMAAEAQEYRESLAIEEAIRDDPEAREAWLNRQLTLNPVSANEAVAAN